MKISMMAAAAVFLVVAPTSASACIPSSMSSADRQAQTLSWHQAYWNSAGTVRLATLTSMTTSLRYAPDPAQRDDLSLAAPQTVTVTLSPILILKGEGLGEPVELGFQPEFGPGPCNGYLWRDYKVHPSLGMLYVVYSDFTTPQAAGEEIKTILRTDLIDPVALAALDAASPASSGD